MATLIPDVGELAKQIKSTAKVIRGAGVLKAPKIVHPKNSKATQTDDKELLEEFTTEHKNSVAHSNNVTDVSELEHQQLKDKHRQ